MSAMPPHRAEELCLFVAPNPPGLLRGLADAQLAAERCGRCTVGSRVRGLQQVLTKPNYQLITSSSYDDTVLFLKSRIPYNLLLIDFESSETEGLKLARRARSIRHRKRMPIVLVAATEPSKDTQMLGRQAGVTEWVMQTEDIGKVIGQIVG